MMKNIVLFISLILFFLLFSTIYCNAQPVTIKDKDFYVGNTKFYPMVMNFSVVGVNDNGNYYFSVDNCYDATNAFECSNILNCSEQLLEHFNYVVNLGFNTVRIVGFAPFYTLNEGFTFRFIPKTLSDDNRYISMNPSNPDDPILLAVLSYYDKILEAADAASLKVILMMKGDKTDLNGTEVELRRAFLEVVASHLNNSIHRDVLFAYDLFNEPAYHIEDTSTKTKQEACEIISTWYDAVKMNAPHHLVTIGNCGLNDIWSFDPSILKVDFNSLHYYSSFRPYEDRNDPTIQQLGRNRTANDLYWFNQASIVPWIVGETGYRASTSVNIEVDGDLNDMGNYVTYSLNSVCNCGGSGYSWWQYQDMDWGVWGGDTYGLLENRNTPPAAEKQPAVNIFRNYTPGITGVCPVDYSTTFDESKTYYNRFGYAAPNNLKITRHVKDQDGNPIQNAVVRVSTFFGKDTIIIIENGTQKITTEDRWDEYYTYTDINGKFVAIPCTTQYGFIGRPQNITPYFYGIVVSAAGAEVLEYVYWNSIPNIITLHKIKDDVVVSGETVSSGQHKEYKGRKSLTVANTSIQAGGSAVFTSQNSITLLPGFTAAVGSEVSIYIAPPNCGELSSFQMQGKSILHSQGKTAKSNNSKEIELSFEKEFAENFISIFPNPANHTLGIQLHSNDEGAELSHIRLYDISGRELLSKPANGDFSILDISMYSQGIYIIEVKDNIKTYYQKIIIQ